MGLAIGDHAVGEFAAMSQMVIVIDLIGDNALVTS